MMVEAGGRSKMMSLGATAFFGDCKAGTDTWSIGFEWRMGETPNLIWSPWTYLTADGRYGVSLVSHVLCPVLHELTDEASTLRTVWT